MARRFDWLAADGRTIGFEVDGADDVRIRASFTDSVFAANHDRDGDGVPDAVRAALTAPAATQVTTYGIWYDDFTTPLIALLVDATGAGRHRATIDRYEARPIAYLGSEGRDLVTLGDGDDVMMGGGGADVLIAGAGNDRLDGRAGRDRLTGGLGSDTFVFTSAPIGERDAVQDFSQSEGDRVDLLAFADLAFIGDAQFGGTGPEVRVRHIGDRTVLLFDLDGDRHGDAAIAFVGAIDFTSADLILAV